MAQQWIVFIALRQPSARRFAPGAFYPLFIDPKAGIGVIDPAAMALGTRGRMC
jgi:hypothetical protein